MGVTTSVQQSLPQEEELRPRVGIGVMVMKDGKLLLAERVVICDSTVTDTLMALPL